MQLSIMLNAILLVGIYPPIDIIIEARRMAAGKWTVNNFSNS
jgi:hypothetical protein